ncbi:MAG: DNA polymerase III subunit gamma/tau [Treponema sp.]|nr:DNA polymerase III subunit gamma/tau [Treponema sp.]
MSYEVTATRRRPQKFDDLIGQEFVAETLKNSIRSNKIAHAFLFSGPRGCGKTSTARILAKALNCQNGPTDSPCGQCSNCQEITKGSSLDVIEIDGASNTSVDNIRQIKDEVLFPPNSCRYKIYIIDEVHMLSTSAFNALLKTIEEPPEYVIFIFATTELQKVPATIKSRCQQYNFRLVSIEKIKQCLAEAAAELNVQADDEALFWIARESTGSMRDAYTLFDQVVAFSDGHITYEKIRDKLGLVGIEKLNLIFESCAYSRTDEVLNSLDEFLQNGISIEQLISNSADYLRSILFIKNGITKESLLGNSSERYSKVVISAWNCVQVERALSIFLNLYRDIRYSLSPRSELELAFSRMCWLGQYVSPMEVKKAIDAAQSLLAKATGISDSAVQSKINQTAQNIIMQAQDNVQKEMKIPDGLPRLSALDKKPEADEPEQTPPFHDGGPLPPEQSVEQQEKPVVNEKLIIHGVPGEVKQEVHPVYSYEPPVAEASQETYDDDGWTNTDEPPVDYSSYEEENEQPAPAQKDDVQVLKGKVIAASEVEDSFFAAALEKTGEWIITDDNVQIVVNSEYDKSLLLKKIPEISASVSKICGRTMKIELLLKQEEKSAQKQETEIPKQVQIICETFRGKIVAGKQ